MKDFTAYYYDDTITIEWESDFHGHASLELPVEEAVELAFDLHTDWNDYGDSNDPTDTVSVALLPTHTVYEAEPYDYPEAITIDWLATDNLFCDVMKLYHAWKATQPRLATRS